MRVGVGEGTGPGDSSRGVGDRPQPPGWIDAFGFGRTPQKPGKNGRESLNPLP